MRGEDFSTYIIIIIFFFDFNFREIALLLMVNAICKRGGGHGIITRGLHLSPIFK